MQNQKRLDPLPASTSKFWQGAEVHRKEMGLKPKCEHYFEYRANREIICKVCNIGFFNDGRAYITDGHLFVNGQKLI